MNEIDSLTLPNQIWYHCRTYWWLKRSPCGCLQHPGPRLPALPLPPLPYPPATPERAGPWGFLVMPGADVACIGESFKLSSLGYPSGVSLSPPDPEELHRPPLPIILPPPADVTRASSSKLLHLPLSHCLEFLTSLFRRFSSPRVNLNVRNDTVYQ